MQVLWLNILGFGNGHTGWVVTDGSAPYKGQTPSTENCGVFNRHNKKEKTKFLSLAKKCDEVRVLKFDSAEFQTVTMEDLIEAEDFAELLPD